MENIIQFPRNINKFAHPVSEQERSEIILDLRRDLSDEISEEIMQLVVNNLIAVGLINPEMIVRDAIFLEETIKAIVYRYKNVPHQFHSLIDDIIIMPDDEDEENEDDEELFVGVAFEETNAIE
jgi:hypothetical protein